MLVRNQPKNVAVLWTHTGCRSPLDVHGCDDSPHNFTSSHRNMTPLSRRSPPSGTSTVLEPQPPQRTLRSSFSGWFHFLRPSSLALCSTRSLPLPNTGSFQWTADNAAPEPLRGLELGPMKASSLRLPARMSKLQQELLKEQERFENVLDWKCSPSAQASLDAVHAVAQKEREAAEKPSLWARRRSSSSTSTNEGSRRASLQIFQPSPTPTDAFRRSSTDSRPENHAHASPTPVHRVVSVESAGRNVAARDVTRFFPLPAHLPPLPRHLLFLAAEKHDAEPSPKRLGMGRLSLTGPVVE